MRIPRLYVDAALIQEQPVALSGEQTHRLTRVLRLREHADLRVFNGRDGEFTAVLQRDGQAWRVVPRHRERDVVRPALHITLAQSVTRGERMDFALQKAVELGVSRIQPVLAERGPFKASSPRLRNRPAHWQRIVIQACEQCGRNDLPQLLPPRPVQEWMADNRSAVMLCAQAPTPLSDLPVTGPEVTVLVGPEGGFSDAETAAAAALGLASANLGPRTLRTETTALVALAVLQTRFGDLR